MVKILAFIFILSAVTGNNVSNVGFGWNQCPGTIQSATEIDLIKIREEFKAKNVGNYGQNGACIGALDGTTNWLGVMAGVTALIPGAELIAGVLALVSTFDLGGSYSPSVNDCVKQMISEALENNDFNNCKQRMIQIQGAKEQFLLAIEQPLDDDTLDYAEGKIAEITDAVLDIQADFGQASAINEEERHHEKFLDFLMDSMAIEGSVQVLLINALEEQMFPQERLCTMARNKMWDMKRRYHESFEDGGDFNFKTTLDEFWIWQTKLEYTGQHICTGIPPMPPFCPCIPLLCTMEMYMTQVKDGYRGDVVCAECISEWTIFTYYGYCIDNGQTINEWSNWHDNPSVVCDHCKTYAYNQQAVKTKIIDEAKINFEKLMNAIKEVEQRWGCPDPSDVE